MKWSRGAGVLLRPTSLPSPYGIGDLGPEAADYVDWLASAGVLAKVKNRMGDWFREFF